MRTKPIIGIVVKYNKQTGDRVDARTRDEIIDAIIDNGGIPIGILPSQTEPPLRDNSKRKRYKSTMSSMEQEDIITQINLCDGVILQGGSISLDYECFIAKYTFDNNIPTLGICAGQNNMIVAVGGTIKNVADPAKHNQPNKDRVHNIYIDKDSMFYKIVRCEKMVINSRHVHTIDNPTSNYKVAAIDDDGYYDVLEAPGKDFNLAIRFHPESLYEKYARHNAIFKAFIKECSKRIK